MSFGEALISDFDSVTLVTQWWVSECLCSGGQRGMLLMLCIVVIEQGSVNYGLQAASNRDHMWPHQSKNIYYLAPYRKFASSCHML